jgi:hypothetical protein
MLNLMLESVVAWEDTLAEGRDAVVTLSPGLRTGWNHRDAQTIVGIAAPVVFTAERTSAGALVYVSYELPFRNR